MTLTLRVIRVAILVLLAAPLVAAAQPAGKVYRIGSLTTGSQGPTAAPLIKALEEGLRELGYVEGRNVAFEHRYADLTPDRLPALVAELVRLKVAQCPIGRRCRPQRQC